MKKNDYIKKNLINFYSKILLKHNIKSEEDLKTALDSGEIDLEEFYIDLNKVISPKKHQEALDQNPDHISINGKEKDIRYDYDSKTKEFSANVQIDIEDLNQLALIPTLPSGRVITLEISKDKNSPILFRGKSLTELKQKAKSL